MDEKQRLSELLKAISGNKKYSRNIFQALNIYFIIKNGTILEIPDDASCSPKGGWFPEIVCGLSAVENDCLAKMMCELGFDESFFRDLLFTYDEYNDKSAIEYFEDNEDDASMEIYFRMKEKIESGITPFASMNDFVLAVGKYSLDSDSLYYEWEGEYIDFYDNISDVGEPRNTYENLSDNDWIEILENIDSCIVKAD